MGIFNFFAKNRIWDDYRSCVGKALELAARNKYDESLKLFDKAIEIEPEGIEAYLGRGLVKRVQENYKAAISDYDKAIEIDSNCVEAYCWRGFAKSQLESPFFALMDYNKAIDINPNFAEAYYLRGQLHIEIDRHGAFMDWKKAYELGSQEAKEALEINAPDYLTIY